jgi:hypothetical protein
MKTEHTALRTLLWLICIYHIGFGIAANLAPAQVNALAASVLGQPLPDNPALYQILKPFGIYAMIFGVMMGVAAWNPVKNRALITIGMILFGLRLLQRLLNLDEMQQGLGVSAARNWATIVAVACFALLLGVLRWKLYREMHSGSASVDAPSR